MYIIYILTVHGHSLFRLSCQAELYRAAILCPDGLKDKGLGSLLELAAYQSVARLHALYDQNAVRMERVDEEGASTRQL